MDEVEINHMPVPTFSNIVLLYEIVSNLILI